MRYLRFIALLLSLTSVIACSGETRKVKNVVTFYNKVLVDAYLRPNPKLMENFTSKREQVRIDSYIAMLLKENKILKSEIEELTFEDVKIDGDNARAITKERWIYSYIDARTRKPLSEEYDIIYSNTYSLVKQDGRWVVNGIEAKEVGGKGEAAEEKELDKIHKKLYEEMEEKRKTGK